MISTPIFTRLLNTSEFGQYNIFNSWLGIITVFVGMNLAYGVFTQGLVKFENETREFSSTIQGLSTVLVISWTLIYLIFHDFFNALFKLTSIQMLAMLIMIWTTSVFNFWASYQRVKYKYKSLVIITLLVSLGKPLVGVLLVINANDKVTARILGLVLVELIGYTGLYVSQLFKGNRFYSSKYWKYALIYNLPLIPHYLSQIVLNSSDRIMIGNMVGDSEAGIYSLAYSLSSMMILFNTALMQTMSPWIYKKIKEKKIKDIESIGYLSLVIIASVNLCLIAFAPEAVAIFAPKTYHDAIWIIPPVAMSAYYMYSYDLFAKFAFYYEKTKLIMGASVIGAILNIVLNYICIKIFGYIAAGYTTLVCYMVYSVAHYILMNKICNRYCHGVIPYSTKRILTITSPFMLIGFALLFTYSYPLIRYSFICFGLITCLIKRNQFMKIWIKLITLKKS